VAGATTDRFDVARAFSDGKSALALARSCGYAWAERDGMRLMADAREAESESAEAGAWREQADAVDRRMAEG
jgi:hypothetical protein